MIITYESVHNTYKNIENVERIENIKDGSVIVSFSDETSDIELDFENIVVIRE